MVVWSPQALLHISRMVYALGFLNLIQTWRVIPIFNDWYLISHKSWYVEIILDLISFG
jgi:hypothetical protein